MNFEQTLQKLTLVFREVFDDESIVLTSGTSPKDIELWDSVNHIRLVLAIEDTFGVSVSLDGDLEKLVDVQSIVEVIAEKSAA